MLRSPSEGHTSQPEIVAGGCGGKHFHLVIETGEGNLVDGLRWLLSTYSSRLNHRQGWCGHVFSGRFKALLVDGSGGDYQPPRDDNYIVPSTSLPVQKTISTSPASVYRADMLGGNMKFNVYERATPEPNPVCVASLRRGPEASAP